MPPNPRSSGKVAFAPMPVFEAGADAGIKGSSVDGSSSFAIMATTPYPDQTWKFLTYLASNEVQTKYSAEMLPIWQADFQGDSLAKLQAATPTNPVTVPAFLAQFPYANERPTVPYYNEASAALQLAIQEALTGVKTPQQALDEAAAKWVELAGTSTVINRAYVSNQGGFALHSRQIHPVLNSASHEHANSAILLPQTTTHHCASRMHVSPGC